MTKSALVLVLIFCSMVTFGQKYNDESMEENSPQPMEIIRYLLSFIFPKTSHHGSNIIELPATTKVLFQHWDHQ